MIITGKTSVYGIIGYPVSHSLSPEIHNRWFAKFDINAVYVPFPSEDLEKTLPGLFKSNVKGLSVTIPHKTAVIPFLDEISPASRNLGAVNTVFRGEDNRFYGSNTDGIGALRAMNERVDGNQRHSILILGTGGSARSIFYELSDQKWVQEIGVLSRNRLSAEKFLGSMDREQDKIKLKAYDWTDEKLTDIIANYNVIINCTPLGMSTFAKFKFPLMKNHLVHRPLIFDIVYSPLHTPLIKLAQQMNCEYITGDKMLLYQAAAQFELWTGIKVQDHDITALHDLFGE